MRILILLLTLCLGCGSTSQQPGRPVPVETPEPPPSAPAVAAISSPPPSSIVPVVLHAFGRVVDRDGLPMHPCNVYISGITDRYAFLVAGTDSQGRIAATAIVEDTPTPVTTCSLNVIYREAWKALFDTTIVIGPLLGTDTVHVDLSRQLEYRKPRGKLLAKKHVDRPALNLRAGPTTDAEILATLPKYRIVSVYRETSGWSFVEVWIGGTKREGWVYSSYLAEGEPFDTAIALTQGWVAIVSSSTEWSGYFVNRTVDGKGNRDITLPGQAHLARCVTAHKQTEWGYLTVEIGFRKGDTWISHSEKVTTRAAYGVVSVCQED